MVLVSFAWYGTMMLIPAANRPYVGDSTNNSWFQLIFGANGLSRVFGGGGRAAHRSPPGRARPLWAVDGRRLRGVQLLPGNLPRVRRGRLPRRAVLALALAGSGLALLAGPAAYSIATVGHGQTGSNPTAGPASVAGSGFGGGFAGGGHGGSGRFAGTPGTSAGGGAAGFGAELGRGFAGGAGAGSRSQSDQANAALAGFMGADPAPTVAQLESLVRSGQLRYVLVGGRGGGGFAAGGGGGFGGGGGRDSGVSAERTQWVESHCQTVTVPGASTSDSWPLRVHASRRLVTAPSSYGWRRDEASDRITRRCLGCPGLACARRGGVGERRRDRLCHG